MTRDELESSPEYKFTELQIEIFRIVSEYKEENHLGRKDLSVILGVSKNKVNLILNGDYDPKLSELFKIMSIVRPNVSIKLSED